MVFLCCASLLLCVLVMFFFFFRWSDVLLFCVCDNLPDSLCSLFRLCLVFVFLCLVLVLRCVLVMWVFDDLMYDRLFASSWSVSWFIIRQRKGRLGEEGKGGGISVPAWSEEL